MLQRSATDFETERMLKKRTRPVITTTAAAATAKQGLMADHYYSLSSPRVFVGFSPKGTEMAMSPTSILETKPFAHPLFAEKSQRKPLSVPPAHQPVGLGIVDELKESPKPDSRMVLFGSQLKIQIPCVAPVGPAVDSPRSPIEFGIKNKKSQLALLSPAMRSPMGSATLVSGSLSATEMEMSDDYTCVIAHGPNPRTTHIFDNCVIESCGAGEGFAPAVPRKNRERVSGLPSDDFLTSCHACKKSLGQGKDIFMYRGEKAFCSRECRYQEILFDEGIEDCSPDQTTIL